MKILSTDDLEELAVEDFDLALTLNCGQVFHWQRLGPGYCGTIDALPVYLEQRGDRLLVTPGCAAPARDYLALDHPMEAIYRSFPDDPAMQAALTACRGLRIIRQPLWECLATFITSALKQVGHIAQISHRLRQRYGQHVGQIEGQMLWSYPAASTLAALPEADLRACGLGFRAASLLAAARRVAEAAGMGWGAAVLDRLRAGSRSEALAALTEFRGVGTKVANCVLLFGYGFLEAFPIDVWIERVLREKYFPGRPDATLAELQRFSETHFGPYGGYAQQYFFHHARVMEGRQKRADSPTTPGENDAPIRRVRRAVPGKRGH